MIKKLFTSVLLASTAIYAQAQDIDTLVNHAPGETLISELRTGTGDWGYLAGHSSEEYEQFAERYDIEGHVHVLGVIAHLKTTTNTISNTATELEFLLYSTASNGKPDTVITHGHILLGNVNLNAATYIEFDEEVVADDESVFVALDLGDYAHDPIDDTVGLYYTQNIGDGDMFRNVVAAHSHSSTNWLDFFTQAEAGFSTHFALYPVVEIDDHDTTSINRVLKNGLEVFAPYPNPAKQALHLSYSLDNNTDVTLMITDINGRIIKVMNRGKLTNGTHTDVLDVADLNAGMYNVVIATGRGSLAVRFSKM